jgi:hypothetical protein
MKQTRAYQTVASISQMAALASESSANETNEPEASLNLPPNDYRTSHVYGRG